MRTALGALLVLVGNATGVGQLAAVPPPPPPAGYMASWAAIDVLNSFVGRWSGTEIGHVITGNGKVIDYPARRYLDVKRPKGRDLLFVEGGSDDVSAHAEFFDVITFNPKDGKYEIFLPGYRVFSGSSKTSALVPLIQDAAGHLTWSVARDDGATTRTTVWLDSQMLHRRQELVEADGNTRDEADAVLTKERP